LNKKMEINMYKRIFFITVIFAVFLAACGSSAPTQPPVNPVDVQNTAIAAAQTIVAVTEMARPTEVFIPPTEIPSPTPLPTFTPELVMPTMPPPMMVLPSPTTASALGDPSSGLGECNKILAVSEAGPLMPVRIENQTNGEALLSLYLNKNSFGQCGYMPGVPIIRGGTTLLLPTGNWSFYALITYSNNRSGKSFGNFVVQPNSAGVVKITRQ
jgi:hypothetical protein